MTDGLEANSVAPSLSLIIPVLNEAATIGRQLQALQPLRRQGCEIIVVDGGSSDNTCAMARPCCDQLIVAGKGRARQMNAGAAVASAPWLLFLHADTRLPASIPDCLLALKTRPVQWGFFVVKLSGERWPFRVIEAAMNLRSRITAVSTGDQGLFVRRELFAQCGQFADIPLMEDVAISKRLRKIAKPLVWPDPVLTSSRRWEQRGIVRTVLLMWSLRLAYYLGVSPQRLVQVYYGRH